jgi:deferrochelatase/peroxidase EfeB
MSEPFEGVQRIVLHGTPWTVARHLVLDMGASSTPLNFLKQLLQSEPGPCPSVADKGQRPKLQVSIGFSRRGLERTCVPPHVLACFALKAPAFWEGAALRAARHLGLSGRNAPSQWLDAFAWKKLDAVLSLHAMEEATVNDAAQTVILLAEETKVDWCELQLAKSLAPPEQWVHFGFRDGVARIGIEGWDDDDKLKQLKAASRHWAGEFLLGHRQNSGANPWIAGPGPRVWPMEVRDFFRNGSFAVLHQVHQDVKAFEDFVRQRAKDTHLDANLLKAKLCGRFPDGRSPAAPEDADPQADFDYSGDPEGHACPFGSHARRMNPRGDALAHAGRRRPLLRRGMPYGPAWPQAAEKTGIHRGLIGHFFCASIEDQFEHLLGQWADRIPMGSKDGGGARDPLIGAHEEGDGPFEIPQRPPAERPLLLQGLRPFTRTMGSAYLFYPSWQTLQGIADSSVWGAVDEEDK